jgi:hypothetical protein
MFERYTEKARRAIFFARYEASQYGSPMIETEHLLLGLIRENKNLVRWIPNASPEAIREWIETKIPHRTKIATSVDLPLSDESKKILKSAADEADALKHHHIGTNHLFLAIFSVSKALAAEVLINYGADQAKIRKQVAATSQDESSESRFLSSFGKRFAQPTKTVEIHGKTYNADVIDGIVRMLHSVSWYWNKTVWKPRDAVIHRKSGSMSFDLSLAEDSANFELVKHGGPKKDDCVICRWELYESPDDHGSGYTNGHNWICLECHDKFWDRSSFVSGAYGDLT